MPLELLGASIWTSGYFSFFLMVIGFGLVVFVHELGHFLVAKKVGIKVEEFAIGFGRRLWSFRRGETEYRLNILPLGGYVKMLGQEDFKPKDGEVADPRAYNNRPIWARICVVSAGVVMNVIFAALLFVIVFMVGIRFNAPVVGGVSPGFPAATVQLPGDRGVGLQPGDEILAVNGDPIRKFNAVMTTAMLSAEGETFRMTIRRPGVAGRPDDRFTVTLGTEGEPTVTGAMRYAFGIYPAADRVIGDLGEVEGSLFLGCLGDACFQEGDTIVRFAGQPIDHGWQILAATEHLSAEPVEVVVRRTPAKAEAATQPAAKDVAIRVRPHLTWSDAKFAEFHRRRVTAREAGQKTIPDSPGLNVLGLSPRMLVRQVMKDSPAEKAGIEPGDVVVKYGDEGTIPTVREMAIQSADYLDREAPIWVLRNGKEIGPLKVQPKKTTVTRDGVKDVEVGHIGIAADFETDNLVIAAVQKDSPLAGQIDSGFVITAVDDQPVSTWPQLIDALASRAGQEVTLSYRRPGEAEGATEPLTLTEDLFSAGDYAYEVAFIGLLEQLMTDRVQTYNPATASWWGIRETGEFIVQTYATIRSFFQGRVSGREFSGPVGIFRAGILFGGRGVVWLVYFMAIISANLAVINFLPLPIVDGGHVVFLVLEKLRGRPLSVRIQNAVQIAGLALLAVVFVLLTYNDILHWVRHTW